MTEILMEKLKPGERYPFDDVRYGTAWLARPLVAESIRNSFAQYAKKRGVDMRVSTTAIHDRPFGPWTRITFV